MTNSRFLAALTTLLVWVGPWQIVASAQDYKSPPQKSEVLDASDGSRWIGRVAPDSECRRFVLERADASGKTIEKYRLADQCVIGGVYDLAIQNGIVVALLEGHPADWLLVLDQPGLKECSRTPVGDPIFSPSKRWVSAMRFEPHFQQSVGYGVRSYDVNTCRRSEGVEFGGLELALPRFGGHRPKPENRRGGVRWESEDSSVESTNRKRSV